MFLYPHLLQSWEYGLPLLKSLAEFYESAIRYKDLSKILKRQAEFYDNILNVMNIPGKYRPDPEYFRVGFYGQGFPLFLRVNIVIKTEVDDRFLSD